MLLTFWWLTTRNVFHRRISELESRNPPPVDDFPASRVLDSGCKMSSPLVSFVAVAFLFSPVLAGDKMPSQKTVKDGKVNVEGIVTSLPDIERACSEGPDDSLDGNGADRHCHVSGYGNEWRSVCLRHKG